MKPSYVEGLLAHLLTGRAGVVKVQTLKEAGAVGHHWPPHGLKVTLADGTAVFLATNATSPPDGDDDNWPDVFDPEALKVAA